MRPLLSLLFLSAFYFFTFPTGALCADVPMTINLQTVLEIASQRSPEAAAANERVKQAAARLGQSAARYLPQLGLSASQYRETRNLKANGIVFPPVPGGSSNPVVGPFNSFDARMTVTQTIFDWETVERIRSAAAGHDFSLAERERTRQDVMSLAAVLYLNALRAERKWKVQKISFYEKRQNLKVANEKLAAGAVATVEREKALRDFNQARYAISEVRQAADENKLDLLAMLGIPLDRPVQLSEDPSLPQLEMFDAERTDQLALKHPEVQSVQAQLKQAKADKRAALAQYLPSVSGVLDYGASGSNPSDAKSTYTLGMKVSWPVFEGGKSYFKSTEANSAVRETQIRLDQLREEKRAAARIAAENITQMQRLVEFKKQEYDVAVRESQMAFTRLQAGEGSRQDWIRAFAAKRGAEDDWDEARAASLTAQVQMLHATGQMDLLVMPTRSAP